MTSYNYCRLISEALTRNGSKMSGMLKIAENRGLEKIDMSGGRLESLDIREKTIGLEPIVEAESDFCSSQKSTFLSTMLIRLKP